MTDDVLNWDITSNNRYLVSGRVSLILNSVAALRALEAQDPTLAAKVALLPVVSDLKDLAANDPESQPPDKNRLLSDAAGWATNSGHPGHTNAAIDEVIKWRQQGKI